MVIGLLLLLEQQPIERSERKVLANQNYDQARIAEILMTKPNLKRVGYTGFYSEDGTYISAQFSHIAPTGQNFGSTFYRHVMLDYPDTFGDPKVLLEEQKHLELSLTDLIRMITKNWRRASANDIKEMAIVRDGSDWTAYVKPYSNSLFDEATLIRFIASHLKTDNSFAAFDTWKESKVVKRHPKAPKIVGEFERREPYIWVNNAKKDKLLELIPFTLP